MSGLVTPAGHLGDYYPNQAVFYFTFCTHKVAYNIATGAVTHTPTTLAGSPVISAYKNGGTTESTTGVALTVDFDGRTGLNLVTVTPTDSTSIYNAGSSHSIVITTGTVDGVSVAGTTVATFTINNALASSYVQIDPSATTYMAALNLKAVAILPESGNVTAFQAQGVGTGRAVYLIAGGTNGALEILNPNNSGVALAISATGTSAYAIQALAQNTAGIAAYFEGVAEGVYAKSTGVAGMRVAGVTYGFQITASNGNALDARSTGGNGNGTYSSGNGTGNGTYHLSGTGAGASGIRSEANAGSNGFGSYKIGNGTGHGDYNVAGSTSGVGQYNYSGASNAQVNETGGSNTSGQLNFALTGQGQLNWCFTTGHGSKSLGGGTGFGNYALSGTGAGAVGAKFESQAGSGAGHGFMCVGVQTGAGNSNKGGATGNGQTNEAGASGGYGQQNYALATSGAGQFNFGTLGNGQYNLSTGGNAQINLTTTGGFAQYNLAYAGYGQFNQVAPGAPGSGFQAQRNEGGANASGQINIGGLNGTGQINVGDGTGFGMSVSSGTGAAAIGMEIRGAGTGTSDALRLLSSGSGAALHANVNFLGSGTGPAIKAFGTSEGIYANATSGIGLRIAGVTYGLRATASAGPGASFEGTTFGTQNLSTSTNGIGLYNYSTGATSYGSYNSGTAAGLTNTGYDAQQNFATGAVGVAGYFYSNTGDGIQSTGSGVSGTGKGLFVFSGGGVAFRAQAGGSGTHGAQITGPSSGITINSTSGPGIVVTGITYGFRSAASAGPGVSFEGTTYGLKATASAGSDVEAITGRWPADLTRVNGNTALAELTGDPGATPTPNDLLMLLYHNYRDRVDDDQSGGTWYRKLYNSAGTVIAKQVTTDAGSVASKAKLINGP